MHRVLGQLQQRIAGLAGLSLFVALAPSVSAQTTTTTYNLNNVMLDPDPPGGSLYSMTGSFTWTYVPGDFENGTGLFTEITIPWYGMGIENLNITTEPGQIETSLLGNYHDLGCDVSLKLLPAFGPEQSGVVDSTRSSFDVQQGVSHQGTIVSGTVDPEPSFSSFCFGDGTGTACPCTNPGQAGEGCANSSGDGATLTGLGTVSLAAGDMQMALTGTQGVTAALLFSGTTQVNGGNGLPFVDGLRCAGGQVKRLGVRMTDASGARTWGPGLDPSGNWAVGDTRYFQAWYRDASGSPCNTGSNLTGAVKATFTL